VPGFFAFQTGSLWATDATYFDWDPYFTNIFWEQWLNKDRLVFRLGQLTQISVIDSFRFADGRTQFTNSQLSFPAATIPLGPPSFGLNTKWWPIQDSELYVVGSVTDINGPAPGTGDYDWSGIFETGEVLAALEIGHNWKRGKDDFDHAHLNLWYATEASRKNHATDEGWGFKLNGSKQIQKWVGFASYAYNTALGGGFGFTNSRQAVDVGIAYLDPLKITGEATVAISWGEPLDDPDPIRGVKSNRNQWGVEPYWRILLTPDLWLTPGVQLIWDPTFNPQEDFIAIYQIKARLFF
jgi:carbohydrate-selective porin OprB